MQEFSLQNLLENFKSAKNNNKVDCKNSFNFSLKNKMNVEDYPKNTLLCVIYLVQDKIFLRVS